ncbi:MAG: hypothetical protein RJA05_442 [Planctomycetota bacterium]
MTDSFQSPLYQQCHRLQSEGRYADALDLLDRNFSSSTDRDPTYWMWKGALLLWAGRHQDAEAVLRSVLRRPQWPEGHAGIARWLAMALERTHRFEEAEQVAAPWAVRGDLDCAAVRFRAMLSMGRPAEVIKPLQGLAASARSHVGIQLVLLEAILDLGQAGKLESHAEMSGRCVQLLNNLKRVGVQFNPYEDHQFEVLVRRLEPPFGFRVR